MSFATDVIAAMVDDFSQKNCSYFMALSQKDWEPPNSRIWLAEVDVDNLSRLHFTLTVLHTKLSKKKNYLLHKSLWNCLKVW